MIEEYYTNSRDKLLKQIRGRGVRIDLAEDVLQESFERALKYVHTYDKTRSFEAWFNRIMNNVILAVKNDDRMQGMVREDLKHEFVETTEDESQLNSMVKDSLEKEIDSKDPLHRDVLYLYFLMNVKAGDICQIVEYKRSNVFKIIDMFKKEMREKYEPEECV